jgi:outer membrane protein
LSGHKGALADLDLSLAVYRAEGVNVGARLGTTWATKKYMNAFFGVTIEQGRTSGLNLFTADSGFKDVSLSLGGEFDITQRWSLVANLGAQRLIGDASKSSLVKQRGNANQFSAGAYAVYSF